MTDVKFRKVTNIDRRFLAVRLNVNVNKADRLTFLMFESVFLALNVFIEFF
jgi:hypothetical protein